MIFEFWALFIYVYENLLTLVKKNNGIQRITPVGTCIGTCKSIWVKIFWTLFKQVLLENSILNVFIKYLYFNQITRISVLFRLKKNAYSLIIILSLGTYLYGYI